MHLVLHSDRGTLWISRSLWVTRPTSELVLCVCVILLLFVPHSVDSGLVPLGSGAVLYLCCCVTLVLLCYTQCRLVPLGSGAKRPLTSLPVLSSYYRQGRPHRSSPPRNYEYFVGPRCIQPAPTYHRPVSQISKPQKNSLALWFGGTQV